MRAQAGGGQRKQRVGRRLGDTGKTESTFAGPRAVGYKYAVSTAILELKEKVERLTSEERHELMQILEDIEDNALADKAEAGGKFISLDDYKKLKSEEELA